MDAIREFLDTLQHRGLIASHLRGVFHIAIGRKVTRADGSLVSAGVTWRELSVLLKDLRFDKELARELGADPETLAPRDRQRFWYSAIALARVDSAEAFAEAARIAAQVQPLGYVIGPPPPGVVPAKPLPPPPAKPPAGRGSKKKG